MYLPVTHIHNQKKLSVITLYIYVYIISGISCVYVHVYCALNSGRRKRMLQTYSKQHDKGLFPGLPGSPHGTS